VEASTTAASHDVVAGGAAKSISNLAARSTAPWKARPSKHYAAVISAAVGARFDFADWTPLFD
jgi:hypothetical protein